MKRHNDVLTLLKSSFEHFGGVVTIRKTTFDITTQGIILIDETLILNDNQHNSTRHLSSVTMLCRVLVLTGCHDTQHHDTQYHDTQHNDIQHTDTQHKGFICDTQHK